MITQTQARVVRDATLKHIDAGATAVLKKKRPPTVRRSRSRRIASGTKRVYKRLQQGGIAVGLVHYQSPKGGKRDIVTVGMWDSGSGRLVANFIKAHDSSPCTDMCNVIVSRHAIERVSERLATLDTHLIRNELAPAVLSLAHHHHQGRGGWVKTPNGIVRFEFDWESCGLLVTTYIADWHMGSKHKSLEFEPVITSSPNWKSITIETPASAPLFAPIFDKPKEKH